jgi:NADP-dependent 3-hydroxy acid dehydrogenase YdfG
VCLLSHLLTDFLIALLKLQSVSPGVVDTPFFHTSNLLPDFLQMRDLAPVLDSSDIADAVMYLLQVPYHVNITEMTVRPVGENF